MTKMMRVFGAIAAMALACPVNAQGLHIYTPEERAAMTKDGSIPTMITPSELREFFENSRKEIKPTGHVSYCNAGLLGLSSRKRALASINGSCGGDGRYTIVRAVPLLDPISTPFGGTCNRSEMIIFRCDDARP